MIGWIPIADRLLPAPREDVLIVVAGLGEPYIDLGYRSRAGDWRLTDTDDIDVAVTHWMPLPALPAGLEDAA